MGQRSQQPDGKGMSDSPNSKLTATYVWVVVVEAVIIVSLWVIGRLFS